VFFKIFVCPLLQYATSIWFPHLNKSKNLLEKVQHKFTKRAFYRSFCDTTRYENRLTLAGLESLETRRIKFDLIFLLKIVSGDMDLEINEFLELGNKTKCNRHSLQLKSLNRPSNHFGQFNYFYCTYKIWNYLLKHIFDGEINVKKFKSAFSDKDICFHSPSS